MRLAALGGHQGQRRKQEGSGSGGDVNGEEGAHP
jgi:hypothetical protein